MAIVFIVMSSLLVFCLSLDLHCHVQRSIKLNMTRQATHELGCRDLGSRSNEDVIQIYRIVCSTTGCFTRLRQDGLAGNFSAVLKEDEDEKEEEEHDDVHTGRRPTTISQ